MNIANRLKHHRKELQLNQVEASWGICSDSYYSKIENGYVTPSDEILVLLCERFGIDMVEIKDENSIFAFLKSKINEFNRAIRYKKIDIIGKVYQEVVERTEMNDDPVNHIIDLFHLRMALWKNDSKSASFYFQRVSQFKDYLDEIAYVFYYRTCGLYHYYFGSLNTSLECYKFVEKQIGNEIIEEVYYQLALIYSRLNKLHFSSYYLEKAKGIFNEKMEYDYSINCNLILGVNYRKMKEYDKALDYYHSILERAHISKDRSLIAKVYHNIGLVYSKQEKRNHSIDYFHKSIELENDELSIPNTIFLLSKEYFYIGKMEEAISWINKGIGLAEKNMNNDYLIKLRSLKHLVEPKEQSNFPTYINKIAIPYFEKRYDNESVYDFIFLLANYYEKERKYKDAYMQLKKLC